MWSRRGLEDHVEAGLRHMDLFNVSYQNVSQIEGLHHLLSVAVPTNLTAQGGELFRIIKT